LVKGHHWGRQLLLVTQPVVAAAPVILAQVDGIRELPVKDLEAVQLAALRHTLVAAAAGLEVLEEPDKADTPERVAWVGK
jgi:hypothetical protein